MHHSVSSIDGGSETFILASTLVETHVTILRYYNRTIKHWWTLMVLLTILEYWKFLSSSKITSIKKTHEGPITKSFSTSIHFSESNKCVPSAKQSVLQPIRVRSLFFPINLNMKLHFVKTHWRHVPTAKIGIFIQKQSGQNCHCFKGESK